ncbi:hypothetical protein H2201_008483 [Coniosporium apollinis]|uniref:Peptidase S54 rhomboid domain-containing protein n=1 Tax=Coniosporium apollinis TaxID=61459 RepID=A0ABQ9NII5_9PEZI|nr:hypothetical protein H2201_008483 [Coniosporium apollinis]
MLTSGFTNAPVSRFLVLYIVGASFLASITDSKYLIHIHVVPHLWVYRQFWRLLSWQACYTNSTEVLFAAMTLYHLRVIERLWGSRKFASFLLSTAPYTTLLPPLLLALVLRPLTFGHLNHLPAGPTPIVFALLAQFHAAIPSIYRYRIALAVPSTPRNTATAGEGGSSTDGISAITLTSKTLNYLLPLQLALSQLPGSAISAAIGWAIGHAYRNDLLPGASAWRVPGWVVGERKEDRGRFEGLRRRLEGEAGQASGTESRRGSAVEGRRRTLGAAFVEQFRGGE